MKFTRCDMCNKEFEYLDEYTSKQSVAIDVIVDSARRDFPGGFRKGDLCSTKCAIAWLTKLNKEKGY